MSSGHAIYILAQNFHFRGPDPVCIVGIVGNWCVYVVVCHSKFGTGRRIAVVPRKKIDYRLAYNGRRYFVP